MTSMAPRASRLNGAVVPVATLLLWGGMVALAWFLSHSYGVEIPTCMFKRVTGWPCATCGGTRAAVLLASGEVPAAFVMNPLVAVLLVGAPLYVAWWVWRGRHRPARFGPNAMAFVIVVSLAINWAYVLFMGR